MSNNYNIKQIVSTPHGSYYVLEPKGTDYTSTILTLIFVIAVMVTLYRITRKSR